MTEQNERRAMTCNGWVMVLITPILAVLALMLIASAFDPFGALISGWPLVPATLLGAAALLALRGFFTVQPNQARVLVFLGAYRGSERISGFRWGNPLATRQLISLRAQNSVIATLKVNDAGGNPIEIAAVVVWCVRDTARAVFDVEDYIRYVTVQSETALRALASHYRYDGEGVTLRANQDQIAEALRQQVQERLSYAGVQVLEARLSHLAYAQEIAQSMLRVQQADAVIMARTKIVEGAVGMVELALRRLNETGIILDDERKAAMTNNLLVALVSESQVQPILNAGTVYQ